MKLAGVFFGALVCIALALAVQNDEATAKKAIQQAYDEQSKAWLKMDIKALENVFRNRTTEDYTSNADGKKHTRKEILSGFSGSMSRAKKVYEYTIKIQSVKLAGTRADVATTGKIVVDLLDDTQTARRLEMHQKVQSVWVKQGSAWKAKSSVITTTKMLVDGREIRAGG